MRLPIFHERNETYFSKLNCTNLCMKKKKNEEKEKKESEKKRKKHVDAKIGV